MTTPAENVDTISSRPGHLSVITYGEPSDHLLSRTVLRNVNERWVKKLRPASGTTVPVGRFGWRPCAPWNHSGRSWSYPPNRVERLIQVSKGHGTRNVYEDGSFWGVAPPAVPGFPNGLINQAEVKALNKLKDQDFNLGAFLAEFDETSKMVAGHVIRIARSVRRWRAGNPPRLWKLVRGNEGPNYRYLSATDVGKRIPASWLELQYGWKPLMSDIVGAINHLKKPDRDPLIHVKGYAESRDTVKSTFSAVAGTSQCQMEFSVIHRCWVSLYYTLVNPGLAEQSSLGLVNPAEIVWECLPYSFVVDWFLPIGPWMSSLTADVGFQFQGGSRSLKSEMSGGKVRNVAMENFTSGASSVTVTGSAPSLEGTAFNFLRSCYHDTPVPGVYIKNPLSTTHVLNAIALLIESFR